MPALEKLPLFDLFRCPAQQARRKVDTGEITKARQSASRITHQVLITVQVQHLTGITLFEHPLMDTSQLIEAGFIRIEIGGATALADAIQRAHHIPRLADQEHMPELRQSRAINRVEVDEVSNLLGELQAVRWCWTFAEQRHRLGRPVIDPTGLFRGGLQRGSIPQSYTVQRRLAEGVEHHLVANGVEPAAGLAENVRAAYNLFLEHQRSATGNAVELHVLVGDEVVLHLDLHPGGRGVKRIQLANHIAQVVLRSGSAIGQREVTRSERKALRVHCIEDVFQRLRNNPDAGVNLEIARQSAFSRHAHQVRAFGVLGRVVVGWIDRVHARPAERRFVGKLQAVPDAVIPAAGFQKVELALVGIRVN